MGTGGKRKFETLHQDVVEYLNDCIAALDHEFGKPDQPPAKLRNTQEPGVYLFRHMIDGRLHEFEVTVKHKSSTSK